MVAEKTLDTLDLDLPGKFSGKVREGWPLNDGRRLLLTTDRLSVLDKVVGIVQYKGQILNQLAGWWFSHTEDIIDNHLLSLPDPNVALVKDCTPLPVEVIMRSRLTGSTSTSILPRYLAGERQLYGYTLPDDLTPHGLLPEFLLTPTTKEQDGGHDMPITSEEIVAKEIVSADVWEKVEKAAHLLFQRGVETAAAAGYVLADTKYEFGISPEGDVLLIDEIHTPDSSRYWLKSSLEERLAQGLEPESFDKEPIRLSFRAIGYSGDGPVPALDPVVWEQTSQRYITLYEGITGQRFVPGSVPLKERITKTLQPFMEPN